MIPKKLEITNFLSHSYSIIDFDKFNAALILGSYNNNIDESNGSGKSSILESIRWVLFDKARHKKKDDVVKRDATECIVKYEFEVDNNLYRIIRKRNKIIAETDVVLEQWNGSDYEGIGCDTNTATDYRIEEIINFSHDVFINSIYFKQGDISIFTESTPGKRKDILKSLLKLDKWDEYQKIAKKHYTKLSNQITEQQKNVISIEDLEDQIINNDAEIKEIRKNLNEKNKLYVSLNENLIKSKSEFNMLNDDSSAKRLRQLKDLISKSKNKVSKINATLSRNEKNIKDKIFNISKFDKRTRACNEKIKEKQSVRLDKNREGLNAGRVKKQVLEEKIKNLSKEINLGDVCGYCLRGVESKNVHKFVKDAREKELATDKAKHKELSKRLKISEEALIRNEKIVDIGTKAELEKSKIDNTLEKLNNEINLIKNENIYLTKELNSININDLITEAKSLNSKLNSSYIEQLKATINENESQVAGVKKAIDKLNIEYGSRVSNKNELTIKREYQEKLQEGLSALNEKLIIYNKLRQSFGKDGIQSIIIENVVDELENYTNETLAKICNEPTSIAISMQKQSESGSWTETFDIEVNTGHRKDDFEALSGGEKFRISLALRLAFSKILSKRMGGVVKFLLLDEVSSALDPKGLNMFSEIVKQLSIDMKILIITHDDRLKDKFEDIIMVEKDSSGSRAST